MAKIYATQNAEYAMLSACAPVDGRPAVQAVAGTGNGFSNLRLGIDCPCGNPYEVYRNVFKFDISTGPATASKVQFVFSNRADLAPTIGWPLTKAINGVGDIKCQVLDYTGSLNIGTNDLSAANGTVGADLGTVLSPTGPFNMVAVDVTAAYNALKNGGRTEMFVLLRLGDESSVDCQGGDSWYLILAQETTADQELRPRLDIDLGTSVKLQPTILTLTIGVVEPSCVINANFLTTLRDPDDFELSESKITKVRRGNAVRIETKILDQLEVPGNYVDPLTITLTLRDSAGTIVLNAVNMARVVIGHYAYVYQTQAADALGLYTAEIEVTF